MTATWVDLDTRRRQGARRVPHPALGPCPRCVSEDVRPLHDDSDGGRVVGVWCNECSWLAPLAEIARARAVVEGAALDLTDVRPYAITCGVCGRVEEGERHASVPVPQVCMDCGDSAGGER